MTSHFITQKLNVTQLLSCNRAGVRYFHVHIEYDDGNIYVTNVLQSELFSGYVKQLVEVMEENPDEIVIFHIEKTLFNDSTIAQSKFDDMVHGYFNNGCIKSNISDNAGSLKMSDIWKNNDRLTVSAFIIAVVAIRNICHRESRRLYIDNLNYILNISTLCLYKI